MATYISKATGNFSSTSTWAPTETGASAAQATHSTSQTIAGNSNATTGTFTITNGDTVDGVLLWVMRGGTTGTVTVELLKGGVSQVSVTINNSDLPLAKSPVLFKFTANHAADGSSTYAIKVSVSSGGSTLTIYRDATSSNFARRLRLTAAASAAAAGDVFVVVGQLTGAGASNSYTVTMDDAGTNAYGTDVQTVTTVPHTTQNGVDIGQGGTLQWATATGTYQLNVKGHVGVWSGGTLNIGTSGTPMPSGVTGELFFNNSVDGKFGLELMDGATCNLYGLNKTHLQYLAADAAASVASFTLDGTPTNWKNGDEVVLASTTRTIGDSEVKTLSADVSTTTMTTTTNSGVAHSGGGATNGSAVKAEVVNVTRNVRIRGVSASFTGYVYQEGVAAINAQYAEFKWLGVNTGVTGKLGVTVTGTSGTASFLGCVLRDAQSNNAKGFFFNTASGLNYSLTYSVGWNNSASFFANIATSATGWVVDHCVSIKLQGTSGGFVFADIGGTMTNLTSVSVNGPGIVFSETPAAVGTVSNLTAHSNGGSGVRFAAQTGSISTITSWRNNGMGIEWSGWNQLNLDTVVLFGNSTAGIGPQTGGDALLLFNVFSNFTVDAGLVLTQPVGWDFGTGTGSYVYVAPRWYSCNFGANQTHSTGDMRVGTASTVTYVGAVMDNCTLNSATTIANQARLAIGSYVRVQRAAVGVHKSLYSLGTISIDSTVYDVSPAARITPLNATLKLECEVGRVEVNSGGTVTFSVKVRKSVVGDGAAYNGNQPRLVVKRNGALGITADAVLATTDNSANGSWQTLSGTTASVTDDGVLTFIVDCDGTAGWINCDTAAAS
jgi:hypothetical protein